VRVEKHGRGPPLAAPITRVLYLSSEGTAAEHEVWPPPNPALLAQLDAAAAVVYGMGSLYTSICPSLALEARARALAARAPAAHGRLTGPSDRGSRRRRAVRLTGCAQAAKWGCAQVVKR